MTNHKTHSSGFSRLRMHAAGGACRHVGKKTIFTFNAPVEIPGQAFYAQGAVAAANCLRCDADVILHFRGSGGGPGAASFTGVGDTRGFTLMSSVTPVILSAGMPMWLSNSRTASRSISGSCGRRQFHLDVISRTAHAVESGECHDAFLHRDSDVAKRLIASRHRGIQSGHMRLQLQCHAESETGQSRQALLQSLDVPACWRSHGLRQELKVLRLPAGYREGRSSHIGNRCVGRHRRW